MATDMHRTTKLEPLADTNMDDPGGAAREERDWLATSRLEYDNWKKTARVTDEPTHLFGVDPRGPLKGETEILSEQDRRKARTVSRMRQIASLIASDEELVLTVLAFIDRQAGVPVHALIEMGRRKDELFRCIWDLYDLGLLERVGGTVVKTTPEGKRIVTSLGLDE